MLPVIISGWFGGFGPGILATFISAVAAWYAGPESVNYTGVVGAALFFIEGGIISYVFQATARKQDRLELIAAKAEIERMNADLEQRVHERTMQLKATIDELEGFSHSISHDLRAPLRAIDGFSNLLLREYHSRLDAEGQTIVGIIRDSAVGMVNLINGLLAFSRLGRQAMDSSEIDMAESVRAAFSEAGAGETTARAVNFKVSALPRAIGDRALIRQVFVNLLSNALKFTKGKDPAIIEVGSRIEGDQNIFYVRDNGVGFDMRYAGKLFGVFQRFHAASEFEGTGLGLAIVQRIVQRHGGRVWAESALGEGTTIFFSLPRITSRSEEERHAA